MEDIITPYINELKQLMRLIKVKTKEKVLISYLNELFARINVMESITPHLIVELSGLGIFKYTDNIIDRDVKMFLERSDKEWYDEINFIDNESKNINNETENMSEEEKRSMLTIIRSISKIWTILKDNEKNIIFNTLDNLITLYSKYLLTKQ